PRVAAASKPMKDKRLNTTPRPTPENPLREEATRNTAPVLLLAGLATANTPRISKMKTSITSSVRSRLTEALMLRRDSQQTTTIAARLSSHHGTKTRNVASR